MRDEWIQFLKWTLAAHASLWVGGFIVTLLLTSILRERRNPSASAAWLVFMLTAPYVAVPLYLTFGTRKLKSLVNEKQRLFKKNTTRECPASPTQQLLSTLGVPDWGTASRFQLHATAMMAGQRLDTLLREAEQSIDIEMFILGNDASGQRLIELLTQCARHGVSVRLLLDSVGSFLLPRKRLQPLVEAGGKVAWFIPVLHRPLRGRTNLRNHRKLILTDGNKAWSGGRNLADEYLLDETQSHWRDLSFDFAGPVVEDYQMLFEADWAFACEQPPRVIRPVTKTGPDTPPHKIQILPSGPDMEEDVLEQILIALLHEARQRILLITPYYVPTETLQTLLCVNARSGIQVDLLLPQQSNHRAADFVRSRFLRELHEAGVNIRLMPDDMLHAKAWIIDNNNAVIGSANTDVRSLRLNFELMTLLYSEQDIQQVQRWAETCLARAVAWQPPKANALRETLEGLVMLFSFQL